MPKIPIISWMKSTLNKNVSILSLLMVAACASGLHSAGYFPIDYTIEDDVVNSRIKLSYENATRADVCLHPENWPFQGVLLTNGREVSLEVGDKTFFLDADTDYCRGCYLRVKAGQRVEAWLDYAKFGLPDTLKTASKTLSYKPIGASCRGIVAPRRRACRGDRIIQRDPRLRPAQFWQFQGHYTSIPGTLYLINVPSVCSSGRWRGRSPVAKVQRK